MNVYARACIYLYLNRSERVLRRRRTTTTKTAAAAAMMMMMMMTVPSAIARFYFSSVC